MQLSPGNPTNTVVSEYASLRGISTATRLSRNNRLLLLHVSLLVRWWVESFFNVMFGLYVLDEKICFHRKDCVALKHFLSNYSQDFISGGQDRPKNTLIIDLLSEARFNVLKRQGVNTDVFNDVQHTRPYS